MIFFTVYVKIYIMGWSSKVNSAMKLALVGYCYTKGTILIFFNREEYSRFPMKKRE